MAGLETKAIAAVAALAEVQTLNPVTAAAYALGFLEGGSSPSSSPSSSTPTSTPTPLIAHVVLFRLKEGADVDAVVARLESLNALPMVVSCTAGPLDASCYEGMADRARGYNVGYVALVNKDLEGYAKSDLHVSVVKDAIKPNLVEGGILAFDWTLDAARSRTFAPGDLIHIVLFRTKPDADAAGTTRMLEALHGLGQLPMVRYCSGGQLDCSYYESMADRSRGYTIGYFAVVASRDQLEGYAKSDLHMDAVKTRIKPMLDVSQSTGASAQPTGGILAIDFVVGRASL